MMWGLSSVGLRAGGPRPCVVVCTAQPARSSNEGLQPWQVSRLQIERSKGRRAVQVSKLADELGLDRSTVLQWLKEAPAPDDSFTASLAATAAAAEEAARQRQAILQQRSQPRSAGTGAAAEPTGSRGQQQQHRQQQQQQQGGDGIPPWRRRAKDKPLGRQAEATLETIFSRTHWPNDEVISSLWDLHRIPKSRAVEWFAQRRRSAAAAAKRKGSSNGGGSGGWQQAKPQSTTDWDAEWGEGSE